MCIYSELEKAEPFTRKIHEDELWLYKNPRTDSYVPTTILWVIHCRTFYTNSQLSNIYKKKY